MGAIHFALWSYVCWRYLQAPPEDSPAVGGLVPQAVFFFSPLAPYLFYIIAGVTRMPFQWAFLIGTPLHLLMLGMIGLALRFSPLPLLLLVGPLCWFLYVRALYRIERLEARLAARK